MKNGFLRMKTSELSELSEHLIDVSDASDGSGTELNGQLIIADVSGSVNLDDNSGKNFYTVENGIRALQEKDLSLEVTAAVCRLFFQGKRVPFTIAEKRNPRTVLTMVLTMVLTHGGSN